MKKSISKALVVCFLMTANWLILSLFFSTRAFAEAELFVVESRINHQCGGDPMIPPLGYFNPNDSALVSSQSLIFPSTYGHDGCPDKEFYDENLYQDPVRVNRQRKPCRFCGLWLAQSPPPPPHSNATASGFADAGRLSLGAYSEARPDPGIIEASVPTQAQSQADASFRNRFTVLSGNSGLPVGAPVRLRWDFRLYGKTEAQGRTFPRRTVTSADVNFDAQILRELEVCQPEDGGIFCLRPTAARFGLGTRTQASDSDPNSPFTPGETGSIFHRLDWNAQNNLGVQLGAPVTERAVFTSPNDYMFRSFLLDSGALVGSLEFEANVGETLEIKANLWTLAILGGGVGSSSGGSFGSTRNNFFTSFNNNVVDPENRGLQLVFEIAPETLNAQPVAHAGQDGTGSVGHEVTLDGSASTDPDESPSPLNFRWFQIGGPAAVTLIGDTTAAPTFTPLFEGAYTFRLIVDDGEFDSSPDDIVITAALSEENSPPTANAGPDQTVECASQTGAQVTLNGMDSSDPESDTLTYTWTGPFGATSGSIATVSLPLGTHTITLTVDDGNGGTDSDQVVVIVQDVTPPLPNLASLPTINGECSANITVIPTATDICAGTITGATSAPLSYSQPGIFPVPWTFTDENGNSATQTQTVVVRDEASPTVNATFAPVGVVNKKAGRFRIQFTCSDSCDPNVTTTATLNGIPVTNGQIVSLKLTKKIKKIKEQNILKLRAPSFSLIVTCMDGSGNVGTATATPSFAS